MHRSSGYEVLGRAGGGACSLSHLLRAFSDKRKSKVGIVGGAALVGAQRTKGARLTRKRATWRSTSHDRGHDNTTRKGAVILPDPPLRRRHIQPPQPPVELVPTAENPGQRLLPSIDR